MADDSGKGGNSVPRSGLWSEATASNDPVFQIDRARS